MNNFPLFSDELVEAGANCWQALSEESEWAHLNLDSDQQRNLLYVLACSPATDRIATRWPNQISTLLASNLLKKKQTTQDIEQRLNSEPSPVETHQQLDAFLREKRAIEMFIIGWRMILGLSDLKETMEQLSLLADWAMSYCHRWHWNNLAKELKIEASMRIEQDALIMLGMGKLGGNELNLSSDIDLIFFYPGSAYDNFPGTNVKKELFYTRLSQRIIRSLDQVTEHGFVFRVDMRLRPYGDSGPIAMSVDAATDYYQHQGRDWERYAMIKARCIEGKNAYAHHILPIIKPFVFRKYIDYGVIDSVREMKGLIQKELRRKNLEDNIKLGAGGIREIEFICQSFQLIRGGRNTKLQTRSLVEAYLELKSENELPPDVIDRCLKTYEFLRHLEHRIQVIHDQQSQDLPLDTNDQKRIASMLGFTSYEELVSQLTNNRKTIHDVFESIIGEPEEPDSAQSPHYALYLDCWLEATPPGTWLKLFEEDSYKDPEAARSIILDFKSSRPMVHLGPRGRKRLDSVMPHLLVQIGQTKNPDETLKRVTKLIAAILRRTAYLALLDENSTVIEHLVRLCSASEWISEHLTNYPILLDELLDHRLVLHPPKPDELAMELTRQLLRTPQEDIEAIMDILRQFKLAMMLRLATAYFVGAIDETGVSTRLGALAELILSKIMHIAFNETCSKYGIPDSPKDQADVADIFAVIAYGKFASEELSLSSDLDIVFLHNLDTSLKTKHKTPLEHSKFVLRFVQRVVHLLSYRTSFGKLYEIDLRLRPSGDSGLLVSSLEAFADYQHTSAWTWEHQALLKARCVFGNKNLTEQIYDIRKTILTQKRSREELAREIGNMRIKMREQLDRSNETIFDLKQGAGALVDIEFLTQFWHWLNIAEHNELLNYHNTESILSQLKKGNLIPGEDVDYLIDTLRWLREKIHRRALKERASVVKREYYGERGAGVIRLWKREFGASYKEKL